VQAAASKRSSPAARAELPVPPPLRRTLVGISRWCRPSPPRKHSRLRGVSSAPTSGLSPGGSTVGRMARNSPRRHLRTELTVARGSRGSFDAGQQGDGSRKRASSRGDEETFMACDRIWACCKRVFYVFQMFRKDVASVSCGCCKSRSGCFSVAT
jgi:hypothetical protein